MRIKYWLILEYFLGYPQPYLIGAKGVKSVFSDNAFAKSTKNVSFNNTFVRKAFVQDDYINTKLSNTGM